MFCRKEWNAGKLTFFGSKREEEAGGWRRLHNEELHNLYAAPNIIRMMKSGRMRWEACSRYG
jgi:hypothetical protein